jgi:hypothetical protein
MNPKRLANIKNKLTKENFKKLIPTKLIPTKQGFKNLGSKFKNTFSRNKKEGEGLNADKKNATKESTENAGVSLGNDGMDSSNIFDHVKQGVFNSMSDHFQPTVQNETRNFSKSAPPRENANANPNSGKRNATNYDVSLDNGNVKVCVTNGRCAYYKVEPVNSQSNT